MIRQPLAVRLDPSGPARDQIREAATLGAKGAVFEAAGDFLPDRLGESGRREVRHLLRSVEMAPVALVLPTRNPFDRLDDLDRRVRRADEAFALAYDLGMALVLIRAGGVPTESEADAPRLAAYREALTQLAARADHRGVRLVLETGTEPGATLRAFLDSLGNPALAASVDPAALLAQGADPIASTRDLGPWVAHAYATDSATGERSLVGYNPRQTGFRPGLLDWEEYLGSLEEINYRGYLTIWPEPGRFREQVARIVDRLKRF